MRRCTFYRRAALLTLCWLGISANASAQGLVWRLPAEDGTWVKFVGTYKNQQARPDSNEGDLELTWKKELTISSVGQETVQIDGKPTACRWVEFKSVVGIATEEGLKPGPFSTRIYKVLIPEDRVIGKLLDSQNLPVTYLPIVRGFRKIANREPTAVTEKVLAVYPMLSMLTHYPEFAIVEKEPQDLQIPLGNVPARLCKGTEKLQNATNRSTNTAQLWLSDDVPFGLARWTVEILREKKDSTAPADAFKQAAKLTEEMAAVEKGTGAQSEISGTSEQSEISGAAEPAAPDASAAATEKPAEEAPAAEKPAAEKPPAEEPAGEKPEAEEAPAEEPAAAAPKEEKPAEEKP